MGRRDPSLCSGRRCCFGFTMIELLLAITIMGILSTVGFTNYIASLKKGRDTQRKAGLNQVTKALESYLLDKGRYPDSCGGEIVGCGGSVCLWGEPFSFGSRIYMSALPKDPVSDRSFMYTASTDGKSYQIYTRLENERDPQANQEGYGLLCTDDSSECNYGVSSANVTLSPALDYNSNCP